MPLAPDKSLMVGLSVAAVVYAIHSNATPTMADIRVGQPNDEHIDGSERLASWMSAAVVGGMYLLTKDPTVFVIGGATIITLAWATRHANVLDPLTGSASLEGAQRVEVMGEVEAPDSEFAAEFG